MRDEHATAAKAPTNDDPFLEAAELAFNLFQGPWKLRVVFQLLRQNPMRLADLQRALPGATPRTLSRQLTELERMGVVSRNASGQGARKVEYSLTLLGKALRPVLRELVHWARIRQGKEALKPIALLKEGSTFR